VETTAVPTEKDVTMSDAQPRDLSDEEINEAGPESTKQASSPLHAAETPSFDDDLDPDDDASEDR
jgi:hypothetical protein